VADPKDNTQPNEPVKLPPHEEVAHRLAATLQSLGYQLQPNWERDWPATVQRIFAKGHNKDMVLSVAKHGVNSQWKKGFVDFGIKALEDAFDYIHADMLKKGGAK
jgi:hypothetical protein